MRGRSFISRAIMALAITCFAGQAAAQAVVSTGQSFVSMRLLPGERQEDGSRLAGLRMAMTPGWKTYWRSPGQAGIPPRFDWAASENVGSVEVLWPRPEVFESFGYRTIGYSGTVVLPLRVRPIEAGVPMTLAVHATVGVCRDICVIEDTELSEDIPEDLRPIGYKQVSRAMSQVPLPAADAGVRQAACRITGAGRDRVLKAELTFDEDPGHTEVVIEPTRGFWVRQTRVQKSDAGLEVAAELRLPKSGAWIDRSSVRMTVLGEHLAADIQGCSPTG